jgi:hypothetical protein
MDCPCALRLLRLLTANGGCLRRKTVPHHWAPTPAVEDCVGLDGYGTTPWRQRHVLDGRSRGRHDRRSRFVIVRRVRAESQWSDT